MDQNDTIPSETVPGPPTPRPERPPSPPKIWGFWATLGWGAGAFVVLAAGQLVTAVFYLAWEKHLHPGLRIDLAGIGQNGPLVAVVTIASVPLLLGYLAWPIRLSRTSLRDYLALHRPAPSDIGIGLAGLVALLVAQSISAAIAGQATPPFMTETYASGRAAGLLPLLAVGFGMAAPIAEESLFRGFLYRGFAQRLGAPAAILITAAAWATMHVQYDLFFIAQILALGLYLGWVRWKSGSTLLTMLLHATVNSLALIGLALGGGS
jgi:CAAX protease family protein